MATRMRASRATPAMRRASRPAAAAPSRVHLYRLDASLALAKLPARSISVLITDPPYRTVNRSGTSGHLQRWFSASLSWRQIGETLALARRRMRPDGVAFVMTNSDGLRDALEALAHAGFVRVRLITWDKRTPGLGGGLRHQTEIVLVGYLPGSRALTGVDLVSVPAVGPGTAGRYPTEKPEGLGRALARIAGIGRVDVVVDPFCGSGALLVGAYERGATVVGCDVAAAAITRATVRLTGRHRPSGSPDPAPRIRPARPSRSAGTGRPRTTTRRRGP
jgi:DNA modification methylase